MPNLVNRMVLRELTREFQDAGSMVIVSYGGLTVAENETLRDNLAAKGVKLRMVNNRLARVVLRERGLDFPASAFKGNTAVAYGDGEGAIHAAKVLTEKEVKKAGKVRLRAGMLEGSILDETSAQALATLPDRKTINAMILGVLCGPSRGLVTLIDALPSGTARVLQARADKLEATS